SRKGRCRDGLSSTGTDCFTLLVIHRFRRAAKRRRPQEWSPDDPALIPWCAPEIKRFFVLALGGLCVQAHHRHCSCVVVNGVSARHVVSREPPMGSTDG